MNLSPHFSFSNHNQKGFTLIEFVVASALALLISAVVGSLYFYTSRLNHIAKMNLKIQEDLRYTAQLINRDTTLAGNFGCLSLGSLYQKDSKNIDNKFTREFHVFFHENIGRNSPIVFDRPGDSAMSENQSFGVNIINADTLQVPNFTAQGNALIFHYGIGSAGINNIEYGADGDRIQSVSFTDGDPYRSLQSVASQGGYFALASCQALNIFKVASSKNDLNFTGTELGDARISFEDETNKQKVSELSLLRYVVHAYAVGVANGQQGLYKIELNENGHWGPPVLLSEHVTNMQVSFLYPTAMNAENKPIGCPTAFSDDVFSSERENLDHYFNNYSFYERQNATFNPTESPSNPKSVQGEDLDNPLEENFNYLPPAAVNVVLNVEYPNLGLPFGLGINEQGHSNESIRIDIKTGDNTPHQNFRIFSSIRGGNQCANRNLIN